MFVCEGHNKTHLFLKFFSFSFVRIFFKQIAPGFSVVCVSRWSVHVWKVRFCRCSSVSGIDVRVNLSGVSRPSLSCCGIWRWGLNSRWAVGNNLLSSLGSWLVFWIVYHSRWWWESSCLVLDKYIVLIPYLHLFVLRVFVKNGFAVLLVILELTLDPITIWIGSSTFSVSLSVSEITLVVSSIGPGHLTFSVHVVLNEFSFVDLSWLREVVLSLSVEFAVNELSLINVTIKLEFTFTSLLAINEVTSVNDLVVVPLFSTLSMILVIFPLTLIHWSLLVDEDTMAGGFSILPLTLVNITVWVSHSSLSVEETLLGLSLIFGTIWELNCSETGPLLLLLLDGSPLTRVSSAIFNIESSSVPVETFAATDRAQRSSELRVAKKDLLGGGELTIFVDWLLLGSNALNLHEFLESSSSNCTLGPFVEHLNIVACLDSSFDTGWLFSVSFLALWGLWLFSSQIDILVFDTFGSTAREHSLFFDF